MPQQVKIDQNKHVPPEKSSIWTTEKVLKLIKMADEKGLDFKKVDNPFYDNDPDIRRADLLFEYTLDELQEIKKCATDVVYFAENYCKVMTDMGYNKIRLRDYQVSLLRAFKSNRRIVLKAPRQVGKTISSSIFLLWYLLFNYDKNAMLLANIGETAEELMSKIKEMIKGLPFFLKPGINVWNVMTVKFDNNCRIMAKTTTKTSAIGFTIHFLYMDEFAHINPNFIDSFFQSTYPTISSSSVSRVIITSTPNGLNKFYEIYTGGLEGKNDFLSLSVDWWQVPGRDDEWRKKEIANLGSEESFNQEYGCQFLSSSTLLLDGPTLGRIKSNETEYVWREIIPLHDLAISYENMKWHPMFDINSHESNDHTKKFVFAIDTSGGVGGDYSVINILKVVPKPLHVIEKSFDFESESDFMSLLQVGMFRCNKTQIDDLAKILVCLCTQVFSPEQVKIVLEMDFRGELLYNKVVENDDIYEGNFLFTKHSESARRMSPGIKLGPKNKLSYCDDFKFNVKKTRIIPNEIKTIVEIASFGQNSRGSYSSQVGHDDIVMTLVNLSPLFRSGDWPDLCGEVIENLGDKWKEIISKKMMQISEGGELDFSTDALKYKFMNELM